MTDTAPHAEAMPTPTFEFLRDGSPEPQQLDWTSGPGLVRKAVGEALNARNVAFLLPTTFKVREASPLPHSDDTRIVDLWFQEAGRPANIKIA